MRNVSNENESIMFPTGWYSVYTHATYNSGGHDLVFFGWSCGYAAVTQLLITYKWEPKLESNKSKESQTKFEVPGTRYQVPGTRELLIAQVKKKTVSKNKGIVYTKPRQDIMTWFNLSI